VGLLGLGLRLLLHCRVPNERITPAHTPKNTHISKGNGVSLQDKDFDQTRTDCVPQHLKKKPSEQNRRTEKHFDLNMYL